MVDAFAGDRTGGTVTQATTLVASRTQATNISKCNHTTNYSTCHHSLPHFALTMVQSIHFQ